MTVNHNELLSALVDGELEGQELDDALQLLYSNEQLRQQWQRYQRASDVLHGHSFGQHDHDLTKRISMAVSKEPTFSSSKNKARVIAFPKQFWKQAVSLAVAASVGALAVVGVMSQPQSQLLAVVPNEQSQNQVASNKQLQVAENASSQVATVKGKRWTVGKQEVEKRLNSYLVDHNEYANSPDVFSYARVVSYDVGQ